MNLMSHLIAGFPDAETSIAIADALVKGGANILEIQLAFSDPSADGPAIQAFRKGKLMMSEPGGLLYDLDEDAKTAIGLARNNKIVPYHVIHQGSVYAVLGVSDPEMSDHKEAWADEHISRDGWVPAFVYNTQFGEDCAEWGEIQVASINGGMQLLAVREDRHYNHPR